MIALDTSVIVAALLSRHEHHPRAWAALDRSLRDAEGPPLLPVPSLLESFSVLTRLPPPWRVSPQDAHRLLADTFRPTARLVAMEGDAAWALLEGAVAHGIAGGAIQDAHIAACARLGGAHALWTFNRRDFDRLDLGDLEIVTP